MSGLAIQENHETLSTIPNQEMRDHYLDLMHRCLLNMIYGDPSQDPWSSGKYNEELRISGRDWPSIAHTMIGHYRMLNIRLVMEHVLENNIPGDFIETGVWRGGACIYARAIIKAFGDKKRKVWVADSFEGLPKPDEKKYPADKGDEHYTYDQLSITIEDVKNNFLAYDLLDNQVKFLKGWFKDTLPTAPIDKIAVLRLDGDMYESTMDGLNNLYHKVSPDGFVIVDDYGAVAACAQAVTDFRNENEVIDPIKNIDGIGVYWQKSLK